MASSPLEPLLFLFSLHLPGLRIFQILGFCCHGDGTAQEQEKGKNEAEWLQDKQGRRYFMQMRFMAGDAAGDKGHLMKGTNIDKHSRTNSYLR